MFRSVLTKSTVAVVAGFATMTALVGATATPALAATSLKGRIVCTTGRVVGMWVDTNAGGAGWASWTATSDPYIATYSKGIPSGATRISVTAGCGGSPASWGGSYPGSMSVGTGAFVAGKDWSCGPSSFGNRCS